MALNVQPNGVDRDGIDQSYTDAGKVARVLA